MNTLFSFDDENDDAQAAAEEFGGLLIKDVSQDVLDGIRAAISRSIREGIPPYDAARMVKSMIGLTAKQAQSAMDYREQLINIGLNLDKVEEKYADYVDEKLSDRSKAISRTETLRALNAGALEAWKQAQDEDILGEDAVKVWMATEDDNCCDECDGLDGEEVGLKESFDTEDDDGADGPPAHPNCRCTLSIDPGSVGDDAEE